MEKETDFESYCSGYRQAVFDLTPVPEPPERRAGNSGVFLAYIIGLIVGALIYKFSKE